MNNNLMTSRRFAPLFWTQFLSAFNDNFLKNTLVFLILFKMSASEGAALVTLAGVILIVPFLLLSALGNDNLESRLVEALPWVVLKFPNLDWRWLTQAARMRDLQNRLGYVTSVARRLAELRGEREKAALLATEESALERSRLAREDTLCHESLTDAEKKWLRKNRPPEARHWRLLTDLSPERLDHAI